jgi:phytanoyl-CoA hydroxylase
MKKDIELDPQLKKSFDEDGYVAIRGFLDADEVAEMNANLDRYISEILPGLESTEVFYEDKDRPETLMRLNRMYEHDAFFDQEVAKGKLKKLAELLMGGDVDEKGVMFFNKPPRVGQPTPPHQDGYYWDIKPCEGLTMWLALETVDEENGCVHYSRGSHKLGLRDHNLTETIGFSQGVADFPNDDDRASDVAMFAEAGDLLVHHAQTVHWASGNDSITRSRKSMGIPYYAAGVVTDEASREAYQEMLHKKLEAAGKI